MYDVNYFIEKFEGTLSEIFLIGNYCNAEETKFCALGLCGKRVCFHTDESNALIWLFDELDLIVSFVNDGTHGLEILGSTPKQRVLKVLYEIRDKELQQANIIEVEKIINEDVEVI